MLTATATPKSLIGSMMSEVINEIMKHSVISKGRPARLTISSIAAFVLSIGLARVLSGRCRPFTTVYEFRLLSQSHVASVHCSAGSEGSFLLRISAIPSLDSVVKFCYVELLKDFCRARCGHMPFFHNPCMRYVVAHAPLRSKNVVKPLLCIIARWPRRNAYT